MAYLIASSNGIEYFTTQMNAAAMEIILFVHLFESSIFQANECVKHSKLIFHQDRFSIHQHNVNYAVFPKS